METRGPAHLVKPRKKGHWSHTHACNAAHDGTLQCVGSHGRFPSIHPPRAWPRARNGSGPASLFSFKLSACLTRGFQAWTGPPARSPARSPAVCDMHAPLCNTSVHVCTCLARRVTTRERARSDCMLRAHTYVCWRPFVPGLAPHPGPHPAPTPPTQSWPAPSPSPSPSRPAEEELALSPVLKHHLGAGPPCTYRFSPDLEREIELSSCLVPPPPLPCAV